MKAEVQSPETVRIIGELVRLRDFRSDDLDDSLAVVSDDRVTRWLSFDSLTREQQERRLADTIERAKNTPRTEYYLAVTTHTDDRLIGFARLGLSGVKAAKIGGAIAFEHRGKRYAIDATRTMITYGFTTLGLHRITAATAPANAASIGILERLGFTREGRLRDHVFTNGAWRDSELYSVLEHEWPPPEHVQTKTRQEA